MYKQLIVIAFLAGVTVASGQTAAPSRPDLCAWIARNPLPPSMHFPEECYPERTLDLAHNLGSEQIHETAQILKSSLDLVYVNVDVPAFTLTVHGSPEKTRGD